MVYEVVSRTLSRRFRLQTTERPVFEALRYLQCAPDIVAAETSSPVISVLPHRAHYRIAQDGRTLDEVIDTRSMVDVLHAHLFAEALRERPRSGIVHAALLRRQGRRVLLAGSRGAGKTTLTLRLARAGYEVEGDEHVFIDPDGVIARPRACRVKQGALALLPDLASLIEAAPRYRDAQGRVIYNVEPVALGGAWRIEKGAVDCIVILAPNHGGHSSIRRIPAMMAAQALLSEIGMRNADRGASIAAVAALVGRAESVDLSLGDHDGARACIDRALDGVPFIG